MNYLWANEQKQVNLTDAKGITSFCQYNQSIYAVQDFKLVSHRIIIFLFIFTYIIF